MKLPFGLEVKRFQRPKTVRVKPEIGGTGVSFFGGVFSGVDYNPKVDVSTRAGLNTVEEMLNSDATVKAALNIIELPLKRAKWIVEYDEDEDIKEFVEQSLFEDMDRSWIELLDEILDYLPFGHAIFEKVFKVTDKGIQWLKWGTRLQTSIERWEMSNGQPGIQQRLGGKEAEKTATPDIPLDKLIIFTNEQKGIDVTGKSILRAAYKNWFMKQAIEKIDAIAHERQGIGVPVIRSPGAYSAGDKTKAENMAKNFRANEKAYVYLPGGPEDHRWEFDIADMKANSARDPHKSLQYHDRQILKNVLAQFINLGAITAGTRNVADVQAEIFFLSVEAIAEFVSHVINTKAIKELVDVNFGEQEVYPKLKALNIRQADLVKFADAISKLVTARTLTPEDGLEEHTRELMKLPPLPEELKGSEREQIMSTTADTTDNQAQDKIDKANEDEDKVMGSVKKNMMQFSGKFASKREKVFLKQVSGLRRDLESFYKSKFKKDFDEYQYKLRTILIKGYSNSTTKVVNGVTVLRNSKSKTELIKKVKDLTRKFNKRSLQNNRQEAVHKIAMNRANKAIQDVEMSFALKGSNARAMLRLYKYNIEAWFKRESRHIIESIEDNYVGAKAVAGAIKDAAELKLSEMVYRLSTLTHPEALFRNMIYVWASELGFDHWKAVISEVDMGAVQLNGITMSILYMILTKDQWDKKLEKDNVISSMGIHYNGQVFFYPVSEEELTEEEKIAKEQRKEFLDWINKRK